MSLCRAAQGGLFYSFFLSLRLVDPNQTYCYSCNQLDNTGSKVLYGARNVIMMYHWLL